MSSKDPNVEDLQQTQYNELVLVLNKVKLYVEMVAKRLSETCEDVIENSPRTLEGITLRDYQLRGCKWILRLYENGMNGILADEMGLGKTVQVTVVAPLSLLSVWVDQLATFAPRLPSLVYYGALDDRLKLRRLVRKRVRISMENCQSTPNYTVDRRSHTDPAVADSVSTSDSIAPKMRQRVPCVEGSPASPCSFFTCKSSVDSHQSSGNHLFENEKAVTVKSVAALHPLQEIPSSTSSSIFDASQSSAENPESCRQKLLDSVLGINLHNSFTVNDMGLQRVDEYENESPGNTPASPNKSDSGCTARPSLALIHLDEVISEVLRNSDGWYESKLDSFTHLSNSTTDQDLAPNETSIPLLYNTPLDTKAVNSRAHIKADVCSRNDVLWTCPIVLTSYEVALRDATYLRRIPFKCLVVDEGQRLKNPGSKLYKRLAKFNAGLRLLLTGTPLQNRISELWSLMHFVLPEVFTSLEMFEVIQIN
ncbi:Lymphoid-specific helicase [Fasciolopsis buskii]|uniref:Lymphoid-specific helicase n=1 Tax=Fasciolopsis buskii TaxID=27845 RepID=A0A8E0VMJ8_9TREM|nr:Lymphoid-specific helicase [Fasciolopsis buski]